MELVVPASRVGDAAQHRGVRLTGQHHSSGSAGAG